jgi:AcrR family transcriptional regulator
MSLITPREKRQARTRQEILDAAVALIGEKGPDNFSLRALARRVDYSPAGLYEYFDGKDDIINAVCAEGDMRLQTYLKRVPGELPIAVYLVELGLAYVDFALNNVEHFMLMFARVPDGPLIPYAEVAANEAYGILLGAVQTAVEDGFVHVQPHFNRDDIAYALWSLAHGLAVMQITNLKNIDYDFAQADRAALRAFVRGLAAA